MQRLLRHSQGSSSTLEAAPVREQAPDTRTGTLAHLPPKRKRGGRTQGLMQGSAPAPIDTTPQSARLRKLRATVENALRNEMATTAVWYADKLVTLSRGNVEDVLLLARSFYANGDHARAARVLETRVGRRRVVFFYLLSRGLPFGT